MPNILVYSATGVQSAPLLSKLQFGKNKIYAQTRNKSGSNIVENEFVTVVEGSLDEVESLIKINKGIDIVILNLPFFSNDASGNNAITAAVKANVKLIIWNPNGAIATETSDRKKLNVRMKNMDLLHASGIPYLVFQPTIYLENLLLSENAKVIKDHNTIELVGPPEQPMPWISTIDVSECIVKALDRKDTKNKVFIVSGRGYSGTELANTFSEVLGKKILYKQISISEYVTRLDTMLGKERGAEIMGMEKDKYTGPLEKANFPAFPSLNAFKELEVEPLGLREWIDLHRTSFIN